MNGKERVLRTFYFKEIDRVPISGGSVTKSSFLEKVSGNKDFWSGSYYTAIKAYRKLEVDIILQLVLPYSKTQFWVEDYKSSAFNRAEYKQPEDILKYINKLPSKKKLQDNFSIKKEYDLYLNAYLDNQKNIGEDIFWLPGHVAGVCRFEWYEIFGYENYLMALALYKDKIQNLFEYSGEEGRLRNIAIVKAIKENNLPAIIYLGEDICGNSGPMISIEDLKEIYFPYLKEALKPFRDNDIKVIWHCDGNIMPILDMLIEIGIDGFQGFQEELGVDIKKIVGLKTIKEEKPLLIGSVSATRSLPFGSVDDVAQDTKRCIDIMAPGGGFVLSPSSSICPDVPDENIMTFFRVGKTYSECVTN